SRIERFGCTRRGYLSGYLDAARTGEEASMADWVTAIGTMFAGLAAVAGVILAALAARTWRAQSRLTKQPEVPSEAIVAALDFIAVLFRMSPGYAGRSDFVAQVERRWDGMAEQERVFRGALARAMAFLPDGAVALLLDIDKQRSNMRSAHWVWAIAI